MGIIGPVVRIAAIVVIYFSEQFDCIPLGKYWG